MIVVMVKMRLHSPAERDCLLAALSTVAAKSRREPGVIEYRIAVDPEDPSLLHSVELYESEEAMSAHNMSGHMAVLASEVAGLDVDISLKAFSGKLEACHLGGMIGDEMFGDDPDPDDTPFSIH